MLTIMDKATNILEFVLKGIGDVFDFILELPGFINSLINIIPSPFKSIILGFIGLIIVYFIAKAVMSIAS